MGLDIPYTQHTSEVTEIIAFDGRLLEVSYHLRCFLLILHYIFNFYIFRGHK